MPRQRWPVEERFDDPPGLVVTPPGQMQIDLGRLQILVTEVHLQDFQIHSLVQHGGGVRMSQRVRDELVAVPVERSDHLTKPSLDGAFADRTVGRSDLTE